MAVELRNDTQFYELCDELGLYVVDEANIESHGVDFHWSKTLGNKAEWGEAHLARVQRYVDAASVTSGTTGAVPLVVVMVM